ncbi:hypothetical protein [Neolewinella persica]|nr:hypothetical protein [Neolewinella persica]
MPLHTGHQALIAFKLTLLMILRCPELSELISGVGREYSQQLYVFLK